MLLRHPLANRELLLGAFPVAYAFTRSRRRSIGFSVGPKGLSVRAPNWVSIQAVEDALRTRADWIVRKLQEAQQRQSDPAAGAPDWRDGVGLPFLGEPLTLVLNPTLPTGKPRLRQVASRAQLLQASEGLGRRLLLDLAITADAAQIRDATRYWWMLQAQQLLTQRLDHYAVQIGVRWQRLGLSNAATRWGSARVDGSIRLNWRLLHFSLPVIDYVVVHELCHLRVMDHSPRFWELVASVVPDHLALRRHLKQTHTPLWD